MTSPFQAYEGDEPYLFVSYAHRDAERIYKELQFLHDAGINIWYDEGITPGSRWSDELANAIDHADLFLVFLTEAAVQSENCLNEMDFALRRRRPFLAVELEPVTLPPGIELNIGNRQSILSHRLDPADYRTRLLDAVTKSDRTLQTTRGAGLAHAPPPVPGSRSRSRAIQILAAAGALLLVGLLGYYLTRDGTADEQLDTLAVLPFANLSRDPEFDYLAVGLADELITTLGSINELSVSSRTSSFYYRNQAPQMQDIRERLGVSHAVEGSIRPQPEGVLVNVSLFETNQGRQIWTEQFNATTQEVSEISTQIAVAVAAVLRPQLDLSNQLKSTGTSLSSAAYEAYLKGLDFLAKPSTPETLDAATLFFKTAMAEAPTFARASAALCETYLTYYRMARTEEIQIYYDDAAAQCAAALELDPTLWSGHQALAALYRYSGRYEEALREIRLADTLQPNTASVYYEYGKILANAGEEEAAEDKLRKGVQLDPGFWGGYADLGDHLYLLGRYEEALAQFQKVEELTPNNVLMAVSLGAAYYMLDNPTAAHQAWKRGVRDNPDSESRGFWQSATWLGINSLNQSCADEAAYWQQKAISVSPEDHRLWGRLAESCQMQQSDPGKPDEVSSQAYQHAIMLAEKELFLNPNDWESLGLLALYRARLGLPDSSHDTVDRMLEMQPNNPDAVEIALLFATQQGDKRAIESLTRRLQKLNYPASALKKNPYLVGKQACQATTNEKERLICAHGRIIPALRN